MSLFSLNTLRVFYISKSFPKRGQKMSSTSHLYNNKRPLDSYASPDQSKGKRVKLTNIFKCKRDFKLHTIFWEKAQLVPISGLNRPPKAPFLWSHHSYMKTWTKLETTYKPLQGPHVLARCHLLHLSQPIQRPITRCWTRYFLLAPLYKTSRKEPFTEFLRISHYSHDS